MSSRPIHTSESDSTESELVRGRHQSAALTGVRLLESRSASSLVGRANSLTNEVLPRKRNSSGQLAPVSWDLAFREFTGRMKEIQWRSGKEAVAVIIPGSLTAEESACLHSLAALGMEMREYSMEVSHSLQETLSLYEAAFGTFSLSDSSANLQESDTIVLLGNALAHSDEIRSQLARNVSSPRSVLIDSSKPPDSDSVTQFLQVRAGTEATLLEGGASLLIERGWINQEALLTSTEGFQEFADRCQTRSLEDCAAETGVSVDAIERFAALLHSGERVSFCWSSDDIDRLQPGTDRAALNLAILTGNVGSRGTGANAILVPQTDLDAELIQTLQTQLEAEKVDWKDLQQKIRRAHWDAIRAAIEAGRIQGGWVVATGAAADWWKELAQEDLGRQLEFLVIQDNPERSTGTLMADMFFPVQPGQTSGETGLQGPHRWHSQKTAIVEQESSCGNLAIFEWTARYWGCGSCLDSRQTILQTPAVNPANVPLSRSELFRRHQVDQPTKNQELHKPPVSILGGGQFATSTGMPRFLPVVPRAGTGEPE